MTIATKNGATIVKDGLLAENCACCGGCSADSLRATYDRLRSASCVISLAGNLPRQDAATSFAQTYGATFGSPVSSLRGDIRQWDSWTCPSSLSLSLAASTFQQDQPLGTHSGWIRYRGSTLPDEPLETDRLWVQADIFLQGSTSGSSAPPNPSPPAPQGSSWSLIPGSTACWVRSVAFIETRISSYYDTRGIAAPSVAYLGKIYPTLFENSDLYAWDISPPFYYQNTSLVRSTIDAFPSSGQGVFEARRAYWNYIRNIETQESPGRVSHYRLVEGVDGGAVYTNNAAIESTQASFSIPLTYFNRNWHTGAGDSFRTWKVNDATLADSQWVSNIRDPQMITVNNVKHVEWTRDVAAQKYGPTDFGNNWLTLATLTLT